MSGSARGGAEHLARIHGTEEDKVCMALYESNRNTPDEDVLNVVEWRAVAFPHAWVAAGLGVRMDVLYCTSWSFTFFVRCRCRCC